ncbi:MAG: thiamine phosphate synthase [Bacteroidales bacterium]|nr:thiamine phosphate synthase [Candidatus Scybalocola fimicaballi]
MQMRAFSLQLITHPVNGMSEIEGAKLALEGGCKWVQLRMKDTPVEEVKKVALELLPLCKQYNAVMIIDDHVELAKEVGADGVHLGKMDMNPKDARTILGDGFIIGGTCNSFEDILAIKDDVDYIGCGPFRFTTTKKKLAPVLGLEGYQEIAWKCREKGINIPIVAIGGITKDDIRKVLNAGPNGIAISGGILSAADPKVETEEILKIIEKCF